MTKIIVSCSPRYELNVQIINVTFIYFHLKTFIASRLSTCRLTLIVDLPVAIDVGFADHFVHLLVSELLAQVCHDVPQLRRTDVAITVLWEGTERLL